MPTKALRNFAELTAIRAVPKQLFRRLLSDYGPACRDAGFEPSLLADDESSNEALWRLLTEDGAELPAELLEALSRVDEMADEVGHDLLLEMAAKTDAQLGSMNDQLDARALALWAWLDHRQLFHAGYGRKVVGRMRRFREFEGRASAEVAMPDAGALHALEQELGEAFASRRRSRFCRVRAFHDGDALGFMVSHGRIYRSDEAIEEDGGDPRESWVGYRPQQHDLVVYDNRLSRLRVKASDAPTLRLYCQAFGRALFGDGHWFRVGRVVSLEPLVELGRAALLPTAGIREVRLKALRFSLHEGSRSSIEVKGPDALELLSRYLRLHPADGHPIWCRLSMRYQGGGHARAVELSVPNGVVHDRRCHDAVTRGFLEERGFLAGPVEQVGAIAS
jgi:hypothetical protein